MMHLLQSFANAKHMFWISSFYNLALFLPEKQPREQKQPSGGRGGERPSERRTSALAARMNGIKGETPLQLHCPPLPLATGTQGEPRTCHVTRRAGYPLVAQNRDLNDLGHIPPD